MSLEPRKRSNSLRRIAKWVSFFLRLKAPSKRQKTSKSDIIEEIGQEVIESRKAIEYRKTSSNKKKVSVTSTSPLIEISTNPSLLSFNEIETEDTSDILTSEDMRKLSFEIPKRLLCCAWRKEFSTIEDGFSLSSIYRKLHNFAHRPALLAIKDMNGYRFGAYASEAFHIKRVSFGCGETFVYSLTPSFNVWKWTCKNNFFILCSNGELCIGIDNGKFAIYLDESLDNGRTQACETFDNEPLTPTGDFKAAALEVWIFE